MKIALYGGSFDPIHVTHVGIAQQALDDFELDTVVFVPLYTSNNPDKTQHAPYRHRLLMTCLATVHQPKFEVSSLEGDRKGTSYTIDSIRQLKEQYNVDNPYMIIGVDAYSQVHTWHEPDEILKEVTLLVVTRSLYHADIVVKTPSVEMIKTAPEMSSTGARVLLKTGIDASNMLDPKVYEHIKENKLYGKI